MDESRGEHVEQVSGEDRVDSPNGDAPDVPDDSGADAEATQHRPVGYVAPVPAAPGTASVWRELAVWIGGPAAVMLMVYGFAWVVVFAFSETIEAMFVPWLFSSTPERLPFTLREVGVVVGAAALVGGTKTLVGRAALS